MRTLDIGGRRFGRLVAERPVRHAGRRQWDCRCDCGGRTITDTGSLNAGNTTSCGCLVLDRTSLLGRRFGKLVVVAAVTEAKGRRRWACRCDCGGEYLGFARYFQRGSRVDCGCGDRERQLAAGAKRATPVADAVWKRVYGSYRGNASHKRLAFALSEADVRDLCSRPCHYCGGEPSRPARHRGGEILVNGIDRVDNARGYAPDNVVPCCWRCNALKRDLGYGEFLAHVRAIAAHMNGETRGTRDTIERALRAGKAVSVVPDAARADAAP